MANNKKGLKELILLTRALKDNQIDYIYYLNECEKIIYKKISSNGVKNFNDGINGGGYLNIIKHVLRYVFNNDLKALERLKVDLYIENVNLTIKKLN